MSEHHDAPKVHEPHAPHEEHAKGPHDLKEINPKMTSRHRLLVQGVRLSLATSYTRRFAPTEPSVEKVRAALHAHKVG